MHTILSAVLLLLATSCAFADEVVAYRGDIPILRSQLVGDRPAAQMLDELTVSVVAFDYLIARSAEWEPDEATLQHAEAAFRKTKACIPYPTPEFDNPATVRMITKVLISGVLMQRFIHQNFGGGRLFVPGRGISLVGAVAFDATYRMVLHLENDGAFRILDPALRTAVFATLNDTSNGTLAPESEAEAMLDPAKVFITCEPADTAKAG